MALNLAKIRTAVSSTRFMNQHSQLAQITKFIFTIHQVHQSHTAEKPKHVYTLPRPFTLIPISAMNRTNKQIATVTGGFLMMQKLQQKILAEFRKKCEYRFRNIKFANNVSFITKFNKGFLWKIPN